MNPLERFGTILLVAGLAFFALAAVVEAWLPWQTLQDIPMQSIEEIAQAVSYDFIDLSERYPETFRKYYGEPDSEAFAKALHLGRSTYIAEGCWHCHSQYVRPVSNEDRRFGAVSYAAEYENELQLPQLFGTRRVGPDLIRSAGKHSNDWHVAHFWEPRQVSPSSVMPSFRWFFEETEGPEAVPQPNERGLAMVAFVQWLGSWAEQPDAPLLPLARGAPPVGATSDGQAGADSEPGGGP
ncbi:MAG: cbb3-type cytochrome c oxidase subunit II [Acidobacteriota bacterium]